MNRKICLWAKLWLLLVSMSAGIGNATTTSTFDVAVVTETLTAIGTVTFQGNGFSVGSSTFVVTMGNVGIATNAPVGLFVIGNGTMVVTNTGAVGIGTTTPSQQLEITNNAIVDGILYSGTYDALPATLSGNSLSVQAGAAGGLFGSAINSVAGAAGYNGGNLTVAAGGAGHFGTGGNLNLTAGDTFDTGSIGGSVLLKAGGYSSWARGYIALFTGGGYPTDIGNPPERMRVNGNGNVGIGTSNPAYLLDVSGDTRITGQLINGGTMTVVGNTFSVGGSTLVVKNGNVGISTANPQATLDVSGTSMFGLGANRSTFTTTGALQVGGTGNSYFNGGNVGVGTTGPTDKLTIDNGNLTYALTQNGFSIKRAVAANAVLQFNLDGNQLDLGSNADSGGGAAIAINAHSTTANQSFDGALNLSAYGSGTGIDANAVKFFNRSGVNTFAETMRIDGNGRVGIGVTSIASPYLLDVASAALSTSWLTSSDIRFKENIKPLDNVLNKINKIHGISFDWNAKYKNLGRATGGRQIGMIAQEVEKEFPELVTTWRGPESIARTKKTTKRGFEAVQQASTWIDDYRSMDYGRFTAVLLEAIKEQQKEIEDQQKQMTDLKTRLAALEKGK